MFLIKEDNIYNISFKNLTSIEFISKCYSKEDFDYYKIKFLGDMELKVPANIKSINIIYKLKILEDRYDFIEYNELMGVLTK